jgi:hypothetical protein
MSALWLAASPSVALGDWIKSNLAIKTPLILLIFSAYSCWTTVRRAVLHVPKSKKLLVQMWKKVVLDGGVLEGLWRIALRTLHGLMAMSICHEAKLVAYLVHIPWLLTFSS